VIPELFTEGTSLFDFSHYTITTTTTTTTAAAAATTTTLIVTSLAQLILDPNCHTVTG